MNICILYSTCIRGYGESHVKQPFPFTNTTRHALTLATGNAVKIINLDPRNHQSVNHTTSSCTLKQCSLNLSFLFSSFSSLILHLDSSLVEENLRWNQAILYSKSYLVFDYSRVNVDQTETVQDSDLVEDIVEKHLTEAAISEVRMRDCRLLNYILFL